MAIGWASLLAGRLYLRSRLGDCARPRSHLRAAAVRAPSKRNGVATLAGVALIMDKEAVEWSREALKLLEARLADMRGESMSTRQAFVTDLADSGTPAEVVQKVAGQLIGMLNIAFKLLIELEQVSDHPAEIWVRTLVEWLARIEAETGGVDGTSRPDHHTLGGLGRV